MVLAARRGRVVWRRAYGARAVEPVREQMTPDTVFDLRESDESGGDGDEHR